MTRTILPALLAVVLAAAIPAAPAAALQPPSSGAVTTTGTASSAATLATLRGRGFSPRLRPRTYRPYGRSPYRSYRRNRGFGHFFGNALKFLGIAYLFHAIFGWGAGGGSPFGLLIVVAFIAYWIGRRRSRRRDHYGYAH